MKHPLDLLEKIREKPEPARKFIGAVLVAVIMAVILGVWVTTIDLKAPSGQNLLAESSQPSPFSLFWNFAKESFK